MEKTGIGQINPNTKLDLSIKLPFYLANFSHNRDHDKTFISWCINNDIAYVSKTKEDWDKILQKFLSETE